MNHDVCRNFHECIKKDIKGYNYENIELGLASLVVNDIINHDKKIIIYNKFS